MLLLFLQPSVLFLPQMLTFLMLFSKQPNMDMYKMMAAVNSFLDLQQ